MSEQYAEIFKDLPPEVILNPWFKQLLHTLVKYAVIDDEIGQKNTGWVIGQMFKKHYNSL